MYHLLDCHGAGAASWQSAHDDAQKCRLSVNSTPRADSVDLAVTLELLTGRHVLASPPPPLQCDDEDQLDHALGGGGSLVGRADGADSSSVATPTSNCRLTPKASLRREDEAARPAAALADPIRQPQGSADSSQQDLLMLDAEQEGIAQRLVALNLPMGLIKASGYTSTGHSRPAGMPLPSTAATLFLTDCLQKMPHHRRHCAMLLESNFIAEAKELAPTVALDWIRDPSIPVVASDRAHSEVESAGRDEVCGCGAMSDVARWLMAASLASTPSLLVGQRLL